MPVGCYKQMSAIKEGLEGVIMRLQCISKTSKSSKFWVPRSRKLTQGYTLDSYLELVKPLS